MRARSNRQRHLIAWSRLPNVLDVLEGLDFLTDAVFLQLEVGWRERRDGHTFLVENGDVHAHELCASAKDGLRRLLGILPRSGSLRCGRHRLPFGLGFLAAGRHTDHDRKAESGCQERPPTRGSHQKGLRGQISQSGQKQPERFGKARDLPLRVHGFSEKY